MRDVSQRVKRSLQLWTKLIAMNVRNAMENFHCENLTDEQMKILNPIIRKGIYEALRAMRMSLNGTKDQRLIGYSNVAYWLSMIPECWEDPDLTSEERQKESQFAKRYLDSPNGPPIPTHPKGRRLFVEFSKEHIHVFR